MFKPLITVCLLFKGREKLFKAGKPYSDMKVLIPLLSKNEKNEEFLDKAVKGASEVILLMVIDTDEKSRLKAADISSSTHFLEEVKKIIGKKRKKCEEFTEWGETAKKIKNTAMLNRTDRISLLAQENQWFEELIEELKKEKEIKNRIQVIKVDLEKQKQEEELKEKQEKKELNEQKAQPETETKKTASQKAVSDVMKDTKRIAGKILETGFKGIESIKKIRLGKKE